MRIICTAKSFGYGPISKLLTICKYLKNTKSDIILELVGDSIVIELAKHTNYFNKIHIITLIMKKQKKKMKKKYLLDLIYVLMFFIMISFL